MAEAQWTAVDEYAKRSLSNPNSYNAALDLATKLSASSVMPGAEVSALQGRLLASQCQLLDARNVLEIGTLTAYSTVWLASSGSDVSVTSIEVDAATKRLADQVIERADLKHRVDILLGSAVDVLPTIRAQVQSGERPRFDFVFIDADKQNNLTYFNEAVAVSRSRACVIVDNVVRRGAIADDGAAESDERVRGARQVIEAAGRNERILSATVVQTVGEKGWDGFLMCVVK